MSNIRETRRELAAADRKRWETFDSVDFDPSAYDRVAEDLRRARAAHRSALAAARRGEI